MGIKHICHANRSKAMASDDLFIARRKNNLQLAPLSRPIRMANNHTKTIYNLYKLLLIINTWKNIIE